jgi:hypothetical protein
MVNVEPVSHDVVQNLVSIRSQPFKVLTNRALAIPTLLKCPNLRQSSPDSIGGVEDSNDRSRCIQFWYRLGRPVVAKPL